MSALHKPYSLRHHWILSIPFLGHVLYLVQLWALNNVTDWTCVFISRKSSSLQKKTMAFLHRHATDIYCYSIKFHTLLKHLKKTNLIFAGRIRDSQDLTKDQLRDLLWTLFFCHSTTPAAKKLLKSFGSSSTSVHYTIIFPLYDSSGNRCDFAMQTAATLIAQHHNVYIIPFAKRQWIGTYLWKKLYKGKYFYARDHSSISTLTSLNLFPNWFLRRPRLRLWNEIFTNVMMALYVRRFREPLIWCFYSEAIDFVKRIQQDARVIYDCVDYFTSLDSHVASRMRQREKAFVKLVDYVFVNSNALLERLHPIRSDTLLVPQGFDEISMSRRFTIKQKKRVDRLFTHISLPRMGYIGNLTNRIDFLLLFSLIQLMPQVSFVFIGDYLPMPGEDAVRTKAQLGRLRSFKNVFMISAHSRMEVKEMLTYVDIGIIPYDASQDFNTYCYPMKLFEYFYMGKPVVATPIEELKRFSKYVKIGKTAAEWEKHITSLLSKPWPKTYQKQQRSLAVENSWEKKTKAIETLIAKRTIV